MKIISRQKLLSQGTSATTLAEFEVLKKLAHPNIVRLIEIIDDPQLDKMYLVMELYPKGNLLQ